MSRVIIRGHVGEINRIWWGFNELIRLTFLSYSLVFFYPLQRP